MSKGRGRPAKEIDAGTVAGRVAAAIRAKRARRKLTVEDAARAAGMPAPTWYAAEHGRGLTLNRVAAIAAALGCRLRDLVP